MKPIFAGFALIGLTFVAVLFGAALASEEYENPIESRIAQMCRLHCTGESCSTAMALQFRCQEKIMKCIRNVNVSYFRSPDGKVAIKNTWGDRTQAIANCIEERAWE